MSVRCATCGEPITSVLIDATPGERARGLVEMAAHLRDAHGDEEGALDLERTAIGSTRGPKCPVCPGRGVHRCTGPPPD